MVLYSAAVCALCGCEPIQEQIIGTYEIDADHGCTSCAENGPELMVFEDDDISDGIPGDYRFEFADSEEHSGTYGFLQVDSMITIVLYPENATSLYSQLIGESVLTDYRVTREQGKRKLQWPSQKLHLGPQGLNARSRSCRTASVSCGMYSSR